ncbi:MAG: hypothetical protein R3E96_00625 [Planctomycetota bacterium]
MEVEGVVDVWDKSHYFLRTYHSDYIPASEDVYVPPSLVEEYGLERGMTVKGTLRPNAEGRSTSAWAPSRASTAATRKRSKAALLQGAPYPMQRILLEDNKVGNLEMRILDLITPIGRGQRGLIAAPPRTGKPCCCTCWQTRSCTTRPSAS